MRPDEIARRRLTAQRVAGHGASSVAEVAASQLATQAQDLLGAEWALGLRSTTGEGNVASALVDGSVIRSWPMRGTLMIMARVDARWLTELLAPRAFAAAASVWRRDGMVKEDFDRAADIVRDALSGGPALSRPALLEAIGAAGVETGGGRGSHLLRQLAGETLIVFGPPQGTRQTFVLLDEWAPGAVRYERDDALRILATRYVAGHAPTTVPDLAWWSGLTLTDARRAVALAGDAVEQDAEGLLVPPGGAAQPPRRGDVRLLPPFDEILLGYRDRVASLAPEHFARVVPYSNGLFAPTLVIDGVVSGLWRRTLAGSGGVRIDLEPFAELSDVVRRAVERRAAEYGRYLGREATLAILP
ncbi:hypothetical protein AX769_19435 [Frondihabitans sp. PAMC 28766]|uniref:winged helix DNA-binding domain-containing protein n=1 Tax=Frondihabitans sp. PAMC 28766 TaxID=1795630 RepID=UPI00078D27B7|nr:winged helix DNA-binding domain-containing protein [Frondihabitans sp. PAMC 28766]AMM21920.1 hypothetical protein AX769_19435 [Frondihabitans sp. PAMC 28766]